MDDINTETRISQYADDTKLWRAINSESDCEILQSDKLYSWCHANNMKLHRTNVRLYLLHPDTCKVISITPGHM